MEVNRINGALSPSATAPTPGEVKLQATPEMVQAVAAVNGAKLFGYDSELTFAMDRETRRMVIRLVDRKTGALIRQYPPGHVLDLAQNLSADMVG